MEAKILKATNSVKVFHFVGSRGVEDAAVRLQSEPVFQALSKSPGVQAYKHVLGSNDAFTIESDCYVLFHYNDVSVINRVKEVVNGKHIVVILCFGSDIYSFDAYIRVHSFVNAYIVPTDAHRRVLSSQVIRPVFTFPEAVDPIAGSISEGEPTQHVTNQFPTKRRRRVLWFGYAESFNKGMCSLLPVINKAVQTGRIEQFDLIVDRSRFLEKYGNQFNLSLIDYESSTFSSRASQYDYAILSHLPLDLQLNSYIKSPNKAITALFAGMIPLASDTPNYGELLRRFNLSQYLYSSPAELWSLLGRLEPESDSKCVQNSGAIECLQSESSPQNLLVKFFAILDALQQIDFTLDKMEVSPLSLEATLEPSIGFRAHLSDLGPSLMRAIKSRLDRV